MINQRLSTLYSKWSTNRPSFIKGGVIDEDSYSNSNKRILFLLKEVNSSDSHWSLVDLINKQIIESNYLDLWDTVGLWSFSMIEGYTPYNQLRKKADYLFKSGIAEGLRQIATTNVKKEFGGGQSDMDVVRDHATQDISYLKEEIEIIDPQIVICGGTYYITEELLNLSTIECGSGAKVAKYQNQVFIDMPHPKARVSKQILYAYFKETMLDIEKSKMI